MGPFCVPLAENREINFSEKTDESGGEEFFESNGERIALVNFEKFILLEHTGGDFSFECERNTRRVFFYSKLPRPSFLRLIFFFFTFRIMR